MLLKPNDRRGVRILKDGTVAWKGQPPHGQQPRMVCRGCARAATVSPLLIAPPFHQLNTTVWSCVTRLDP